MMVKVYFGPYRHSPADELPHDERRLWLTDFHLLRGVTDDFWTNNPLALDMFTPAQVHLWFGRWLNLDQAMAELAPAMPDIERKALATLPPGKLALSLEVLWRLRAVSNQARVVLDGGEGGK